MYLEDELLSIALAPCPHPRMTLHAMEVNFSRSVAGTSNSFWCCCTLNCRLARIKIKAALERGWKAAVLCDLTELKPPYKVLQLRERFFIHSPPPRHDLGPLVMEKILKNQSRLHPPQWRLLATQCRVRLWQWSSRFKIAHVSTSPTIGCLSPESALTPSGRSTLTAGNLSKCS